MTDRSPVLGRPAPLPASPEEAQLDTVANPHPGLAYLVRFTCPEFTSLCPVTGQPDFAHFVIDYVPDKTILDFSGQTAGADGLLVQDGSDGVVLTGFTVRDTKGDAIKVTGSNGVTFRKVKAQWTKADASTHGCVLRGGIWHVDIVPPTWR